MLGLSHEIDRDRLWICALVGKHEDFRRTCEHVDAHIAEEHALSLPRRICCRDRPMTSARLPVKSPHASDAIACTPPRHRIWSAPDRSSAYNTTGCGPCPRCEGVHAVT